MTSASDVSQSHGNLSGSLRAIVCANQRIRAGGWVDVILIPVSARFGSMMPSSVEAR
jgi:hypothetical protein